MAVAHDTATSANAAGTSISWSHTCAVGVTALYVMVAVDSTTDRDPSATYNSVAMSRLGYIFANRGLAVFRLVSPATGANTVAISVTGVSVSLVGVAESVTGSSTTAPDSTPQTDQGSGTSSAISVNAATADDLALDFISVNGSNAAAISTANTMNAENAEASNIAGGSARNTGGASVSMSWSWTSGTQGYGHIALNALAPTAGGRRSRLAHMGVS